MPGPSIDVQTGTIANGAAASSVFEVGDHISGAIKIPATMTGSALAIHACDTRDGTFKAMRDASNNAISITFTADTWQSVPAGAFSSKFIKFVSGSNEGAERALTLQLKK
jgi:hypothetical protein